MCAVGLAPNFYSVVATVVLLVHGLFISWVILGALLGSSRPRLRGLHIASLSRAGIASAPSEISVAMHVNIVDFIVSPCNQYRIHWAANLRLHTSDSLLILQRANIHCRNKPDRMSGHWLYRREEKNGGRIVGSLTENRWCDAGCTVLPDTSMRVPVT